MSPSYLLVNGNLCFGIFHSVTLFYECLCLPFCCCLSPCFHAKDLFLFCLFVEIYSFFGVYKSSLVCSCNVSDSPFFKKSVKPVVLNASLPSPSSSMHISSPYPPLGILHPPSDKGPTFFPFYILISFINPLYPPLLRSKLSSSINFLYLVFALMFTLLFIPPSRSLNLPPSSLPPQPPQLHERPGSELAARRHGARST